MLLRRRQYGACEADNFVREALGKNRTGRKDNDLMPASQTYRDGFAR